MANIVSNGQLDLREIALRDIIIIKCVRMPDTLMRDSNTYKNAVRFGLVIPNKKPVVFYFEENN